MAKMKPSDATLLTDFFINETDAKLTSTPAKAAVASARFVPSG